MWGATGLVMCAALVAAALWRSKSAAANFYAHHVYGMTPRTHAAYAAVSLAFAAAFAASYFVPLPVVLLLAAYTLVFIFYFSSFARGFSDEE